MCLLDDPPGTVMLIAFVPCFEEGRYLCCGAGCTIGDGNVDPGCEYGVATTVRNVDGGFGMCVGLGM